MLRRQVLHEHDCEIGVGRHVREQRAKRFQPAGGGADTDDGEAGGIGSGRLRFANRYQRARPLGAQPGGGGLLLGRS
jgi:hypothetical protein